MTDLIPGSRWLLPVTTLNGVTLGGSPRFITNRGFGISLLQSELDTLIPADRITELEAEVSRLRRSIAQIHDMLMAPSPLDEYMLRQFVLCTYLEKENNNVV